QAGRGPEKNIRTWGQAGLTGEWANEPIHVYARPMGYFVMQVFETQVFEGGNLWNDSMREYPSRILPDGSVSPSIVELLRDLKKDRDGITFCDLGTADLQGLKALSLAAREGGPYLELNRQNV